MAFRGTLRDVRLFVAAYEEKSFTAAALRENSTQSGVSHHIRSLEALLDVKLFTREKSGVTATPAADLLYSYSIEALRRLDAAANTMTELRGGYQGAFSIGINPALAHRVAAPAILQFNALHPNVRIRLVESVGPVMSKMILSGELDFAFGSSRGDELGVDAERLLTVPEFLISGTLPQAGDESQFDSQDFESINLVLPVLKERRRALIKASIKDQGLTIHSELQLDSPLAILDLVGRSDWRTVAPCLLVDPAGDAGRFQMAPLNKPRISFSVYLLTPASRVLPPGGRAFVDLLIAEARRISDFWVQSLAT